MEGKGDQEEQYFNPDEIMELSVETLHPFKNHPFKITQDQAMEDLVESIKEYGILTPLVVRPRDDGEYEIVSGHRRHFAAMQAGVKSVPAVVYPMDDDKAVIWMVDSNLQREDILPSERAKAYKMKLDAIKHQGERADLTSDQVGPKLSLKRSDEIVAESSGTSKTQVQRYIRLTNLVPELLDMVDEKKIAMSPAVELSYLKPEEQEQFLEACDYAQSTPSLSQAQRLRKMSQEGKFTMASACDIMSEVKKGDIDRVSFKTEQLRKYFPKSYTNEQMQKQIIKLLDQWQRKRERSRER